MCACSTGCIPMAHCCHKRCCLPVCCFEGQDDVKWLLNNSKISCKHCMAPKGLLRQNRERKRRNFNVVEALSCLFNSSIQHILSLMFKLARLNNQPPKTIPRDREWNVMLGIRAPYTEVYDLEIYDSMYDRCGLPIDPLHPDNILKVLRMMFYVKSLSIEQRRYLLVMLNRLNNKALCPVDLQGLLEVIGRVSIKELACSIIEDHERCASMYNARLCRELCTLYRLVGTTDKNEVIKRRRFKKAPKTESRNTKKCERVQPPHPYCTRSLSEPAMSPRSTLGSNEIEGAAATVRQRTTSINEAAQKPLAKTGTPNRNSKNSTAP